MKDDAIRNRNIEIFKETLAITNAGNYVYRENEPDEKKVLLKFKKEETEASVILSEKTIQGLVKNPPYDGPKYIGSRCRFRVENIASYTAAIDISKEHLYSNDGHKQLVLNFASPTRPGGGVRTGAKAQEEDLCRKSTLLASLESDGAGAMYRYNKAHRTILNSDYMILSPMVEIIRDENNGLLQEPVAVSVLTAAAPHVSRGKQGISDREIENVIYNRIIGMLQVAATYKYRYLVLGAWGCGAFGNDADMMARLFYQAFKDIKCGRNLEVNDLFDCVVFAVLDKTEQKYNFRSFKKYFDHF